MSPTGTILFAVTMVVSAALAMTGLKLRAVVRLDDLRQLRFSSRGKFRVSLVALFGVLFLGLLDGLLLAAVGSLIMVIAHASRPPVVVLGREPIAGHFVNRARHPEATQAPGALVIRSAGAWFYFNADHIRRQIFDLLNQAPRGTRRLSLISHSYRPSTSPQGLLRGLARSLRATSRLCVRGCVTTFEKI
jgi:SulP family sulfate permease